MCLQAWQQASYHENVTGFDIIHSYIIIGLGNGLVPVWHQAIT